MRIECGKPTPLFKPGECGRGEAEIMYGVGSEVRPPLHVSLDAASQQSKCGVILLHFNRHPGALWVVPRPSTAKVRHYMFLFPSDI